MAARTYNRLNGFYRRYCTKNQYPGDRRRLNHPPAQVGDRIDDIDTPALVLELDAFERNLRTLAETVKGRPVRVRAHAKTHKCPEIATRQAAHGAGGVCCQQASEAEAPADPGIGDRLLAH